MATNTYVALDKVTIGTATNTVTFNSIPGTYTDLRITIDGTAASNSYCTLRFNGDTNNNYSNTEIVGDGSTAGTYRNSGNPYAYTGSIYTSQTVNLIDILNYSNSTTFKSFSHEASYGGNSIKHSVGLWRSTSAITSITVGTGGATNFNVGTTFSLYGIRAEGVSPAAKATGGAIYSDDTYYYHAFAASGTFTPAQSLTADVLVVAGGGGGGGLYSPDGGGGGGAGGLLTFASQSLTTTNYTVTVGAGGSADSNGNNSQFGGLTACVGGGRGAKTNISVTGGAGGSGGGGSGAGGTSGVGGAGTAGQGYAGGAGSTGQRGQGAGGGAGAVGGAGQSSGAGAVGGIGATSSLINAIGAATGIGELSSGNYYLAGGGGTGTTGFTTAGVGGLGGGGRTGVNGTAYTGGGGAGAQSPDGGSASATLGGSGVVVVRYAKA